MIDQRYQKLNPIKGTVNSHSMPDQAPIAKTRLMMFAGSLLKRTFLSSPGEMPRTLEVTRLSSSNEEDQRKGDVMIC